ncbi:lipoprotein [Flavobacterium algicola]|uniref:lipoprotein n=1 Tax=Flavobacterium algicola TaxID=556529 RepID=UPI001EFCFA00|nr:lipoprotein [Flavobacterium algicola]MCG9794113.1 lipoprotein [Flavobacterium algicola]
MKKIITTFVILLSLSSCSISTYYAQDETAATTPTTQENIKLYTNNVEQKYTVLGSIAIDAVGNTQSAEKFLKKKAAKIGADAIIYCKLNKLNSFSQRTGISGVAIKYN